MCFLSGRLGKDPDIKTFETGTIAILSLLTVEGGYVNKHGQTIPERKQWHTVIVRDALVPFVEKWVKKGAMMNVVGKIQYKETERDGIKRTNTSILCEKLDLLTWPEKPETPNEPPQTESQPSESMSDDDLPF